MLDFTSNDIEQLKRVDTAKARIGRSAWLLLYHSRELLFKIAEESGYYNEKIENLIQDIDEELGINETTGY